MTIFHCTECGDALLPWDVARLTDYRHIQCIAWLFPFLIGVAYGLTLGILAFFSLGYSAGL